MQGGLGGGGANLQNQNHQNHQNITILAENRLNIIIIKIPYGGMEG